MDKFQITLVVLVVLAQLGGALMTAWKKRQARANQESSRQGGLVVVDSPKPSPSGSTGWGQDSWETPSRPAPSRPSQSSWENDEDDLFEDEEDVEDADQTWNTRQPEEYQVPADPEPLRPVPAWTPPPTPASAIVPPGVMDLGAPTTGRTAVARVAGRQGGMPASRARRLLNHGTLRDAVVAQVVLNRPVSTRRLKP